MTDRQGYNKVGISKFNT